MLYYEAKWGNIMLEKYLSEVREIFTEDEILLIQSVLDGIVEDERVSISDIVQTCFETVLINRGKDRETVFEELKGNVEREKARCAIDMENILDYQDDICLSTTIDEECFVSDFLNEEISKLNAVSVVGRSGLKNRNCNFVKDFVIYNIPFSTIAEDYQLVPSTVERRVTHILEYLGMVYYRVYFSNHHEEYQRIDDAFKNCYMGFKAEKPDLSQIKNRTAWIYGEEDFRCLPDSFFETYENIKKVEQKVYQKRFTKIS